jgi:CBS domain containing-hemolysin-like protein
MLLAISLRRTYYFFPARELKRQSRGGDRDARTLYRAVAYGGSLRLLLWLVIGVTIAASFVLLQAVAPAWLVFFSLLFLIWYAFAWTPNSPINGAGARLALTLSPAIAWILYYIHPILDWFVSNIQLRRRMVFHTGLFERQDLVDLIKAQRDIPDNRITDAELNMALHALTFGEKSVTSTLLPPEAVRSVNENDVLGPILMDELYDSGHSRFPVMSADGKRVVGTLFLRDLVDVKGGGNVRDIMKPHVAYVHEDDTLLHTLNAFLRTKHQQFVVIGDDEQYVGIITLEDVLEQVIGHKIEDDVDSYEDKGAVAERHRGRVG